MGCGASQAVAPEGEGTPSDEARPAAATKPSKKSSAKQPPVKHEPIAKLSGERGSFADGREWTQTSPWEEVKALGYVREWDESSPAYHDIHANDFDPTSASAASALSPGDSVSVDGIAYFDEVDALGSAVHGHGATLVEKRSPMTWLVQPEDNDDAGARLEVPVENMSKLPPLPTLGVSMECLRSIRKYQHDLFETGGQDFVFGKGFTDANGEPATTTQVCMQLVKSLTQGARTSLALCLKHLGVKGDGGHPFVSEASVFVSHAWGYYAKDAFDSMEAYAEEKAKEGTIVYFWFDIFTNDQHDALKLPQLWWREAFLQGVKNIGHTLLILSPWNDPKPLKRAWCLWEILSTVRVKSKFTIQMAPAQQAKFEESMDKDFDTVLAAVSNVDLQQAEAWSQRDKDMIHGAVRLWGDADSKDGFHELNILVCNQLISWLSQECSRLMVELGKQAIEHGNVDEVYMSPLAVNMSRLFLQQNAFAKAEELGKKAVAANERRVQKVEKELEELKAKTADAEEVDYKESELNQARHVRRLALNQLATVFKDLGRYQEASDTYRRVMDGIDINESMEKAKAMLDEHGKEDEYSREGASENEMARRGPREVLEKKAKNIKKRHGDTLDPNLPEVEFNELTAKLRAHDVVGVFSNVLTCQNNLAEALNYIGEVNGEGVGDGANGEESLGPYTKEAKALFEDVFERQKQVFGVTDPQTTFTASNQGVLFLNKFPKQPELAYDKLELAYEARRVNEDFGPRHPDTLTAIGNLATVTRRLADKSHGEGKRESANLHFEKAIELYRTALAIKEEVLMDDHVDTLASVNNLAVALIEHGRTLKADGETEKAKEKEKEGLLMLKRACDGYRSALGPSHNTTLSSFFNLAMGMFNAGRMLEAVDTAQELVDACVRDASDGGALQRKLEGLIEQMSGHPAYKQAVEEKNKMA